MKRSSKVQYEMVTTTEYVEDSGAVTSYGICCRIADQEPENSRVSHRIIPNISTQSAVVENLVDKLNHHEADPLHFEDLVDDNLP